MLHPIAERLARLETAHDALSVALGHDDIHRRDWRLASHLALGLHGLKRLVDIHRAELASALRARPVHEIAAEMVALANAHATDTAGS